MNSVEVIQVKWQYMHRYDGAENVDEFSDRIGRCYELSLRAQLNFANRGWRVILVHGAIGPAKNPHAWLEWRDNDGKRYVWDAILDGIMPGLRYKSEYYAMPWTRYTPMESGNVRALGASNGPWGKRNCERAIKSIEGMIAAGGDKEASMLRIKEIREDNDAIWSV